MEHYKLSNINEYACLVIGDEILGGHIIESNIHPLIKALSSKGYTLREVRIVSDVVEDISEALTALRKKYTFVISMGGIGATHDDRTFEAVADSFGVELQLHEGMLNYFMTSKPDRTEQQKKAVTRMSIMPMGTELIYLDEKWPLIKIENCYIMPGLPSVCHATINKLANVLPVQYAQYYAEWYIKVKEHDYFEWLRELEKKYSEKIALGSYPIDFQSALLEEGIFSKISMTAKSEEEAKYCSQEINQYIDSNSWLIRKTELQEL